MEHCAGRCGQHAPQRVARFHRAPGLFGGLRARAAAAAALAGARRRLLAAAAVVPAAAPVPAAAAGGAVAPAAPGRACGRAVRRQLVAVRFWFYRVLFVDERTLFAVRVNLRWQPGLYQRGRFCDNSERGGLAAAGRHARVS